MIDISKVWLLMVRMTEIFYKTKNSRRKKLRTEQVCLFHKRNINTTS